MSQPGAYIYTRVSTAIQTEGFSLEAQRQKILDYAKFRGFQICAEYTDAGYSGKNIAGRGQFQKMLEDIEKKKNDVQYVLVFKLSRFGRNAADVLNSLQFMQDYGVNLICVEDHIDSSADSGKLMISVMSAIAEIERENILVQTMAGRRQKACSGGWNGGFAPYGYALQDGRLIIVEDEAQIIREVYHLYLSTNKGLTYIAKELNKLFVKKVKKPGETNKFTTHFVKRAIDNPVYCGKLVYGRTVNEKIEGKRNEYHRITQKDGSKIVVANGMHEPIVPEDIWELAHKRRLDNANLLEKTEKDHFYLLAGLLRCPNCGTKMYGKQNGRKYRKDGTLCNPSYSYICRSHFAGPEIVCSKPTSYSENCLIKSIRGIVISVIHNDGFDDLVGRSLREMNEEDKVTQRIASSQKELNRLQRMQQQIENQLNAINYDEQNASRIEESLNNRLRKVFEEVNETESRIKQLSELRKNACILKNKQNDIHTFLENFGDFYDKMEAIDKRDLLKSFIKYIELYPKGRVSKGQWIRNVYFRFPVRGSNGELVQSISFDDDCIFRTATDDGGAGCL